MEIRLYATLREIVGAKAVGLETTSAQTVGDALRALVAVYPRLAPSIWQSDGTLVGHVIVVLDGRDVRHLNGVDTPLGDAKHLHVFPPVGGGQASRSDIPPRRASFGEDRMTHITLKFTGEIWGRVGFGHTDFEFDGGTVREFLTAVTRTYPVADLLLGSDAISMRPYSRLVVNGRFFELVGGLDAPIRDGDVVTLMRPYATAF